MRLIKYAVYNFYDHCTTFHKMQELNYPSYYAVIFKHNKTRYVATLQSFKEIISGQEQAYNNYKFEDFILIKKNWLIKQIIPSKSICKKV